MTATTASTATTATLRAEVERMPTAMRARPRDHRGYPVPWFTPFVDGAPDFRYVAPDRHLEAIARNCCWICGNAHRDVGAFLLGPMCIVNRVSSEPPSHLECAIYAARACPFLARPKMQRPSSKASEAELAESRAATPGIMLDRNPGVIAVWLTREPAYDRATKLFHVGDPERVLFYAHSRKATRDEVLASLEDGLPHLQRVAEQDGPQAVAALEQMVKDAMTLIPAAA